MLASLRLQATSLLVLVLAVTVQPDLQADVIKILEFSPVDIGQPVPTGLFPAQLLPSLNLPMWAVQASAATLSAIDAVGIVDVSRIATVVKQSCDPDLAVHICLMQNNATSCNVTAAATEDNNRFLDLRLYEAPAMHAQRSSGMQTHSAGVRVVIAEDAAHAVNRPLSFNIKVEGIINQSHTVSAPLIGRNRSPLHAEAEMDALGLDWVNGTLIKALVATTTQWPWDACSPRRSTPGGEALGLDFVAAIQATIQNVMGESFSVSFSEPMTSSEGIIITITYALCGHLMEIPATIQTTAWYL